MLSNQVCSLIQHRRIKTTLAKAKATRPIAEKMVREMMQEGRKRPRNTGTGRRSSGDHPGQQSIRKIATKARIKAAQQRATPCSDTTSTQNGTRQECRMRLGDR